MKALSVIIVTASLMAGPAFAQSVGPGTGIGASGSTAVNGADAGARTDTKAATSGASSTTGANAGAQTPAGGVKAGANAGTKVNTGAAGSTLNSTTGTVDKTLNNTLAK
jgi:hypothetical protein